MARIADRMINFVISILLIGAACYAGYCPVGHVERA